MSCGTCPQSAQRTTRKSGSSPTQTLLQWAESVDAWYRDQRAKDLPPVIKGVTAPAFKLPDSPEEAAPLLSSLLGRLTGEFYEVEPVAIGKNTFLSISPHEGLSPEQHKALVSLDLPRGIANGIQKQHGGRWSLCMLTTNEWQRWIMRLQAINEARNLLQNPEVNSLIAQADEKVFYSAGSRATLLCRWGEQLISYQVAPDGSLEETPIDLVDLIDSGDSLCYPTAEEKISQIRQNMAGWLLCLLCGGPVVAGECLNCGQEDNY